MTLNNGSVLTLADAGAGTGLVALTGTTAQTISGTLSTFCNLTVGAAPASLGVPLSVRSGLTLTGNLTTTDQTPTLL